MNLGFALAFVLFGFSLMVSVAAPTAERDWTSTSGTKITAVAEAVTDGKVELVTSAGRRLTVPLDKLVEGDCIS
jgi:hypothetical protein